MEYIFEAADASGVRSAGVGYEIPSRSNRECFVKPPKDALKGKKQPFPDTLSQIPETQDLPLRALLLPARAFDGVCESGTESCPFFRTDADALLWCAEILRQSPTGNALFMDAVRRGWSVGLADLQGAGYSFDPATHVLLVDRCALSPAAIGRSGYFRHALLMAFARGLRDISVESRMEGMESRLTPEAFMILARLRAADCETIALTCAWELRGAGHPHVWRHMIGSAEGDMAIVFARHLEVAPSALVPAAAMAHTFRQWFGEDSRIASSDHDTLEFLDDVLDSAQTRNPFGRARLTAEIVESLSALPDGSRYLGGLGREILSDPSYMNMEDLVNQTHLLHIMRDLEAVIVADVPFRDAALARLIFPDAPISRMGV